MFLTFEKGAGVIKHFFIAFALIFQATSSSAQFGSGSELKSLNEFKEGKFKFESVKSIYWYNISQEGYSAVEHGSKVWVSAQLYMPEKFSAKVPAMVIVHGIGGAYIRDGSKRIYWEYAEELARNGIAALIVDTHGARGVGVASQLGSTAVSVHTFVADAFAAADMLRTHPSIDALRIGIMGFSKGGATALLATDERYVNGLSRDQHGFRLHIALYPGCQTYPEKLRSTGAPVFMLLGEKDNYTGISGCFEIESKLKQAGTPVNMTVFEGAYHGWDENIPVMKQDDVASGECRWILTDQGSVMAGTSGGKVLKTAADNNGYFQSCTKKEDIFVGRNEKAFLASRRAVVDAVTSTFMK